jgi:outer membrane protein TolC
MQSAKLLIQTSLVQAYAELARLYLNGTLRKMRWKSAAKPELMAERNSNGLETDGVVRQMALKERAEAELIAADESIQLQKNAIAALLGDGPDRALSIQRPAIHLDESFNLPANTGINILGHRPDISAARARRQPPNVFMSLKRRTIPISVLPGLWLSVLWSQQLNPFR